MKNTDVPSDSSINEKLIPATDQDPDTKVTPPPLEPFS